MVAYRLILSKVLFLVIILTSCSKEKSIDYYKTYSIEGTKNEPFKKNYYIVFCKNDSKKVCLIESFEIFYNFKKNNTSGKYDVFLNDVFNDKTSLKVDSNDHVCFEINKKIENDYKELNRDNFLSKYTQKINDKKRYLINNKLVGDNNLSVAYFLFKSGFGVTFNEYLGVYYVDNLAVHYLND